ncbi:uncharacterized protein LOC111341906 [Stylophora pistillata]|uniref:uncharacterized protein LOC111341906 n=1 Tax=Stylophora pistillata TaxID=50429 RepID=UPI000C0495E3|nr:uncharacterized protein LOC111341906 [Stylophora pistillata]
MNLADSAFISLFILVALSAVACQARKDCSDGSCCSNSTYIEINEPRRSVNSIWKAGQVAICDRVLRWGWYRFTSFVGGKMPEKKVLPNQCGTHAPIWLKGTHPTKKGENVVRKACINALNIDPDGCFDSFNINITKCPGNYFVYYLRPPWYCSAGYCAGYKKTCPYGKEGEPPNCYDFPREFSSDNINNPEIVVQDIPEDNTVSVTLLCKVNILNGIASWRNVTYKIEWFAEGKSLQVETICGGIPPGSLNEKACPDGTLVSKLPGSKYKIGTWGFCNYFVIPQLKS